MGMGVEWGLDGWLRAMTQIWERRSSPSKKTGSQFTNRRVLFDSTHRQAIQLHRISITGKLLCFFSCLRWCLFCCCIFNFENRRKKKKSLTGYWHFCLPEREQKKNHGEGDGARACWCWMKLWGNSRSSLPTRSASHCELKVITSYDSRNRTNSYVTRDLRQFIENFDRGASIKSSPALVDWEN